MNASPPPTSSDDDLEVPSDFLAEVARIDEARPRDPDLSGQRLGHFELLRCIGRGGMGVVYEALDPRLGRHVAVKVLFAWAGDEARRARFLREARSAAAVSHSHVATVLDIGEAEGIAFIAMELLPGPTLRELLRAAGGRFEPRRAAEIARDVARGLSRLHAAGIVHRDLKPENVMQSVDGQLKIVDFGLARFHDGARAARGDGDLTTEEGRVIGTPGYMSPEQARGERLDARSDVFTLGVILYELLAGQRPFQGRTSSETLIKIDRDAPPPLARLVPRLERGLERVVATCLAKDPAARFRDGAAVAEALGVLDLRGGARRRGPLVAGAALGAAVVVGAFVLLSARGARRRRRGSGRRPLRHAAARRRRWSRRRPRRLRPRCRPR